MNRYRWREIADLTSLFGMWKLKETPGFGAPRPSWFWVDDIVGTRESGTITGIARDYSMRYAHKKSIPVKAFQDWYEKTDERPVEDRWIVAEINNAV